jgi:hypothetical protein
VRGYDVVIISLKESLMSAILGIRKLGDERVSRYRPRVCHSIITLVIDNDSDRISDNSLFGVSLLAD